MKGTASRRIAVEVLLKVELESAYANLALASAFNRKKQLSERDRAFVTYLVQGVIRHAGELDNQLSKLTDRPLSKLAAPLRAVLRLGLFQLIHMKNIPPSAVLNTACQVARATGHEGSAKFANAVLRKFVQTMPPDQNGAESEAAPDQDQSEESLSLRYSMPSWIVNRWLNRFGSDETNKLLEFSVSVPSLTLRVCQLSVTADAMQQILASKGMTLTRGRLVPSCLTITSRGNSHGPIDKIPGFKEGLFSVQDEAAAIVSAILAPQSGWTVIDLCAAPGGKSIHMAELMGNSGRVIAVDIHESRLNLLAKERRRLGLTNIEITPADGTVFAPEHKANAVLVDAPCTGTGVINRRSDLRQRRQEPDLHALVQTQRKLLNNAANLVGPQGTLVYSTCSIEEEENQQNIEWFLNEHPEFKALSMESFLPRDLIDHWSQQSWWSDTQSELNRGMLQLLPSRHGYSGFFISRLIREA